ncbi:hypothetical protein, partial [Pseudomonas aeruginosa]|uniref:hypothetical protein n=1 Tax=Pseudomonas aeruginosa TaxID=287 RepID=UPI003C7CA845
PPRAGRAWPRAPRAVRRAGDHGQPADRAVGTGGADGLAVLLADRRPRRQVAGRGRR